MTSLVAAAKKEGTVTFFGGQDEGTLQAIQTKFKDKYGIQVEYQHLATGPMVQVIERQWDANKVAFDVALATDERWLLSDKAKGKWQAIDYTLPNLAKVPENMRHDNYVATGYAITAVPYNTDLVKPADVPKTSDDLLNPAFKNSIVMVKPETALSIATVYYAWMVKYGDGFEAFLDKLFSQGVTLVDSGGPASQQVAAGEYKIALGASLTFVAPLKEKGAPIDAAFPDPTSGNIRTAEIPVDAPHPNAAKLLTDWLLSSDGQAVLNGGSSAAAYPGATPTALEMPATAKLYDQVKVAEEWDYIKRTVNAAAGKH